MEQFEIAYTSGMDSEVIEKRLADAETGVLSMADGGDAYGIPLAYHWNGESFVFRLGVHPNSEKMAYLETTNHASFLVYEFTAPDDSWSVLATGQIRELPQERAETLETRDDFLPLRLFGEPVEDVEPVLYELEVERLTGRTT